MEDFLFVLDYLEIISAVSFLQIEPYVYNKRYDGNSLTATIRPDITEGTLSCHQRLLSMAGPKMEGTIHRIMAPQYIAIINKCLSPDNKSSSGQILKNLQQSILVKKSLDAYNPVSLSDFISILMMRHAHYGLLSNYQSVVGSSKRILRK